MITTCADTYRMYKEHEELVRDIAGMIAYVPDYAVRIVPNDPDEPDVLVMEFFPHHDVEVYDVHVADDSLEGLVRQIELAVTGHHPNYSVEQWEIEVYDNDDYNAENADTCPECDSSRLGYPNQDGYSWCPECSINVVPGLHKEVSKLTVTFERAR